MRARIDRLEQDYHHIEFMYGAYKNTQFNYVVESDYHVVIEKGKGLDGTDMAVKSPLASGNPRIFKSEEEAYEYCQNTVVYNGNGERILIRYTRADIFFERQMKVTLSLMASHNKDEYKYI